MKQVLPYGYAAILMVEFIALALVYATDPPASSDPFSIYLGWGGIGSMVVMLIYSFARRSRRMRETMRLSYWLHFHIFLGLQGVLFVFFHTFHLFGRVGEIIWINPAMLNLGFVLIVFGSGLFGRYMYGWLPRTLGGEQMAAKEVDREIASMETPFPDEVTALWKDAPATGGFFALIGAAGQTRGALRKLRKMDLAPEVLEIAERRVILERRRSVLASAQRWFGSWIILHRPIAAIMYVLTFVHVALSYMFTPSLGS